ncbi:MAG: hypothetical protein Q9167_001526 [Letrouitia subvulpina]
MPKILPDDTFQGNVEEAGPLLRYSVDENEDLADHATTGLLASDRRQSPLSSVANGEPNTPSTTNRAPSEATESEGSGPTSNAQEQEHDEWVGEQDYLSSNASAGGTIPEEQGVPLLTRIQAPLVTAASTDFGFNTEDLLESARPKSNMWSAFMNMANSIMSTIRVSSGWDGGWYSFARGLDCHGLPSTSAIGKGASMD